MELARIEVLLEKYLEGETSLQEESTLKDYFTSEEVHPSLEQYIPLFSYFSFSSEETLDKNLQLKPKSKKTNWKWLSIAASLTLIISLYTGKTIQDQREAKIAFEQTQAALNLLSGNLQKGNQAMAQLGNFQKTTAVIFNNAE